MAKLSKTISLMMVITIFLNVVCGDVDDNEIEEIQMYGGVRIYKMERQCAMVGGLCAQRTECISKTTNDGLCPENQYRGVECCFELKTDKTKPLPCKQHAGECMTRCHPRIQRPSTDCTNDQVCCVLLI